MDLQEGESVISDEANCTFRVNSRGQVRPTHYNRPLELPKPCPPVGTHETTTVDTSEDSFTSDVPMWPLQHGAQEQLHPQDRLQQSGREDVEISDKWEDVWLDIEDITAESDEPEEPEKGPEPKSAGSYIYRGHWMTVEVSLLLILTFATAHHITDAQLSDLLALISIHCLEAHPGLASIYKFKKHFENVNCPVKRYYYCGSCFASIHETHRHCSVCSMEVDPRKNKFLEVPLESQIQNLFQRQCFVDQLQHRFQRVKRNVSNIEDIYDGSIYKAFSQPGGPLSCSYPYNLSFCLNTDGVPVFKSSKVSIWPVYLMINELEYKFRTQKENMIFCGLWCGESKPLFSVFCRPFLRSLQNLEENGVTVMVNGKEVTSKGFVICSTADLPAKSALMNMVQYNGKFGCPNCLQPGENFRTASGGNIHIFPYDKESPRLRSSEESVKDAHEAVALKTTVNGMKGPSFLMGLKSYNFILSTSIDYMHCVLLGITKCLLNLWFSSTTSGEHFSLFPHIHLVDEWLLKIKPPLLVTRVPRAIGSHFKYWKASELRSWLLFYSLPLLFDLMNPIQFCHYAALVEAIFILSSESISPADIERSNILLNYFVFMMEKIYGGKYPTLNVHALVHLSTCVQNLGPLWAHSCFPFENMNGKLLQLFHGTQNVDMQIIGSFNVLQKLPNLCSDESVQLPDQCKDLIDTIVRKNKLNVGASIGVNANVVGSAHSYMVPDSVLYQIHKVTNMYPHCLFSFNRLMIRNQIYHSKSYTRVSSRNSYSIKYFSNSSVKYGFIETFVYMTGHLCECDSAALCLCAKEGVAIVETVECVQGFFQTKVDIPEFLPLQFAGCHAVRTTGKTEVINVQQIHSLCCCVEREGLLFFSDFPNFKESD